MKEKTREEEETGQKMEETGPSNNFEFKKLPLPALKAFFSGDFLSVRLPN